MDKNEEKFKMSGDDIVFFLRKLFKAGYSRNITFKDENGSKIFKINLIIFAILMFVLPILLFILILYLIITNHSIEIEKRVKTENKNETKEEIKKDKKKKTEKEEIHPEKEIPNINEEEKNPTS